MYGYFTLTGQICQEGMHNGMLEHLRGKTDFKKIQPVIRKGIIAEDTLDWFVRVGVNPGHLPI